MSKLLVSLLCLSVASVSCSTVNAFAAVVPRSDASLAEFILNRQPQMSLINHEDGIKCFTIYLPLLQQISNQWAIDYQKCVNAAKNSTAEVLNQMQEERNAISADADGVCAVIQSCQAINGTLDFFNCFAELGQTVFSPIYAISNNASDAASILQQQLNFVDVEFYRCTNETERTYVQDTARLYDALDHCLVHGPPEVVPPSTSTTTTTTTTSTPPPTSVAPADFIPFNPTADEENNTPRASLRSQLQALLQQRRSQLQLNAAKR